MSIRNKAKESSERAHKKLIATKLLDGIEKLYESKSSERRWVWELLQNAKDVANEQVKVEIVLQKNYVEFKHNGKPFLLDNITYLIEQVSTKDREINVEEVPKTTGKFGTGFMTTHLLSKKVEVRGVLEDPDENIYRPFKLLLDRSATTPEEMTKKVNKSWEVFDELDDDKVCSAISNYKPNENCDTSFRYELDEEGLSIARAGINDLHNSLAYALIFIPEIHSVVIKNAIDDTEISYKREGFIKINSIKISTIKKQIKGADFEEIQIASLSNERETIDIAIEVKQIEGNLYTLVEINPATPMLFCEFPLIGSENFTYPLIINSSRFNPNEPRSGVLLDDRAESKREQNKEIFEEAVSLYKILLKYATSNWQNAYLLAKSKMPSSIDTEWYKSKVQKVIRTEILKSQIVNITEQEAISLENALIPYHSSKSKVLQIWELALPLHADKLPKNEGNHILEWYEIVDSDWKKDLSIDLRYDFKNLVKDIAFYKNITQLSERIYKNENETLAWLNQVIRFAFEDKSTDILDDSIYAIIPNQYGDFKLRKELYKDINIPEDLKNVHEILAKDSRFFLLHKNIYCELDKTLTIEDISEEISRVIRANKNSRIREAVYYLISCFPSNEKLPLEGEIVETREAIWNFTHDLDSTVPDKRSLNHWIPKLWKDADLWLLETLVRDIEDLKDVENLKNRLKKDTNEEAITWLSGFINFLMNQNKPNLYDLQFIFPNQNGTFKRITDLYFDKNIPEELKDVLEKFGQGCRSKLLHRGIRGFEKKQNPFGVKDVSEEIDRIIKDKCSTQSDSFRSAVYDLVSYFPDGDEQKGKDIWEFALAMYREEVPTLRKGLSNLSDFNWDECNNWVLRAIVEDVTEKDNLIKFSRHLKQDWEKTLAWLDNFINFVANYNDRLLDDYAITPSQSEDFKKKKQLKKDGGIPNELKEIITITSGENWNDFLLLKHDNFAKIQELFDKENTKFIEDIASAIDTSIRDYKSDKQDNKFGEIINLLLKFSSTRDDAEIRKLFPYFHSNKPQLFLDVFGTGEVRDKIFDVLQSQKLDALARLAKNENISEKDLNDFAENKEKFKAFQELKDSANTGSVNQIINLLTKVGINLTENVIRALADKEPYNSTQPEVDVKEYIIIETGRKGEEFINKKLVDKFGIERVNWLNKYGESGKPYDFEILDENGEVKYYIDAKATTTGENDADAIPFFVRTSEWNFLKNCDKYYIARVFSARSNNPNVRCLKIELNKGLEL